jgi:ketosteroid isomerase-like protein
MSQASVEIVRRAIEAWNGQDVDAMVGLSHPEIEYVNAPQALEPGTRRGHEGLAAVLREQWRSLPGARLEIDRIHDRGDLIYTEGRLSRSMPGSDARIENAILISWTVLDGAISRLEVLGGGSTFDSAREAAGLDP